MNVIMYLELYLPIDAPKLWASISSKYDQSSCYPNVIQHATLVQRRTFTLESKTVLNTCDPYIS